MPAQAAEAVLAKAAAVFGSRQAAEEWMDKPAIGLNRQKPIDLLSSIEGRELVCTYLTQIEFGVYI
jgi:putative toxin-antitoxin system antitoxin component (TIGR02293 family)